MNKEQALTVIFTVLISITTGFVTGSVIVTKIETNLSWVMNDLTDHEIRIRELEKVINDTNNL